MLYVQGVSADGEAADGMGNAPQLRLWAGQFVAGLITAIFPVKAALPRRVAFDPHHQLDFWNHCEPPVLLHCPQLACRTA
jgi:hypothetical protein